jgi:long-chain acyl-CoA synthetase
MARLSAKLASSRGDETAIIDDDSSLTWRAYDERVNRLLNGLRARGHEAGTTVAVLCSNCHEFLEVTSALFHGGYLYPPVNWHFTPLETAHILDDSGASALVADDRHRQLAISAITLCERPIDLIVMGEQAPSRGAVYEQMLADASPDEPEDQSLGVVMMYTSGTTGRPKGVRSTGMPLGGDIELGELAMHGYTSLFGIDTSGRSLVTAPMYHGGPYLFGLVPFSAGCPIVLRRRFDAEAVLRDIDELEITNAYFVPTHFTRLLRLPSEVRSKFSGASLRTVWHTAAPCPPQVKREMIDWWGPVLHEAYAASDAGVGTLISSDEWLTKPGSVGRASPLSEILIVDDDGNQLPDGETGTICFRNRLGGDVRYHNDVAKTAQAHVAPGVVTVGDVGYLDHDGYLFLSDRKIDMIISGGVNVYPAEVENHLLSHPAVLDAAVFGIPDDEFGERVKAAVLVADDVEPDDQLAATLTEHCRSSLAGYKVPRSFDFPREFPRTETGKLPKRVLRQPYWEGHDRQI